MSFNFSEPIDHVLVRAGVCSNRSFKTFIKAHNVEILKSDECSVPVLERSLLINPDSDKILIDGKKIEVPEHLYIILNKPKGVVCSRVSDSHKTVFDFLSPEVRAHALYDFLHVAGRLDSESRGLVLLTTNGKFSSGLIKPESHEEKTYRVTLRHKVSEENQKKYGELFSCGMELPPEKKSEGFFTKPANLIFKKDDSAIVRICEGKFHQVRRMFSVLGNEVIDLQRISIGKIQLPEDLPEGHFCYLS